VYIARIKSDRGGYAMSEIKSSYEIALKKLEEMGVEDTPNLNEEDRRRIAEIKREYESKIAEKTILLKDTPELPDEISYLKRQRDKKIQDIYSTYS